MIRINVHIKDKDRRALVARLKNFSGPLRDATHQWSARYQAAMRERFATFSRGGGDWPPLAESTIRGRRSGTRTRFRKGLKSLRSAAERLRKARAAGRGRHSFKTHDRIAKATANYARANKRFRVAQRKWKGTLTTGKGISILWDTGVLFGALSAEPTGTGGWIERELPQGIEVGFGGPTQHGDGKATIADIALFHQEGGPNLPQRKIIVEPPERVVKAMVKDLSRAIQRVIDRERA